MRILFNAWNRQVQVWALCAGMTLLAGCGSGPGSSTVTPTAVAQSVDSSEGNNSGSGEMVKVSVFNARGELVGPVECSKVVLNDEEWQKRLTPEQYQVSRGKGTERPFCGTLLDNKKEGVYTCVGCGLPLFSSNAKFNSGTGWPSFFQPIAEGNVIEKSDSSHGMDRVEILCGRCDGHLGHVFEDGPRPTGLRFCLNSASLKFTDADKLASLADPVAEKKMTSTSASKTTATAVFAGGCFWCTEAAFDQLKGVSEIDAGYAGGKAETANYETVSTGTTGHAEVIRIHYDPAQISYEKLLEVFFDAHDPTQLNRQGNDIGTQYRSAIFFANPEQEEISKRFIQRVTKAKVFRDPIVTTLEPLVEFFPAEKYHQDYARLNPYHGYIRGHAIPKACEVREKHPELFKAAK